MSGTLEILIAYAERLAQEKLQGEPYYQKNHHEWEKLEKSFRTRHGRNHALMDEVSNLQDAHSMVLFQEADFLFSLGLQMGLELGKIDLLRDGDLYW